MKFRPLLFLLFFLFMRANAIELKYDGVDCTTVEQRPKITSRFNVVEKIGNLYKIKIEGGLPSLNKMTPHCIDRFFRHGGAAGLPPSSIEGDAIFYEPYLFMFISAPKADGPKSNFYTTHVFTFVINSNANFVLLREEWMGTTHEGVIESGLITYEQPEQIEYQLIY